MNISNGGLIAQVDDALYISDVSGYAGTHVLASDGTLAWEASAIMWFAAPDAKGIYCSNQKDYDYLTYIDGVNRSETRIMKRACSNLIMQDKEILFLDDEDGFVYEYNHEKDSCSLIIKEPVLSFIIVSNVIYFASETGLKCFHFHKRKTEHLADCSPVCLDYIDGHIIFADQQRDFALCKYSIEQDKVIEIDGIRTQSIVATEEYIFVCNLNDSNAIVRLEPTNCDSIRFCGESAEKLHIVDEYLYFLNQNDNNRWYRVPYSGGRPVSVLV